jgi:protein tyrosine/serine phosphatase
VLEEHAIRRIVDLTEAEYRPAGKVEERRLADERDIELVELPLIGDGTGDVEIYARAVATLIESERAGVPTLVHCAAGTQRTGGVVATFRIIHDGWTVEEALSEAERYGWKRDEVAMSNYLVANLDGVRERLAAWGVVGADRVMNATSR